MKGVAIMDLFNLQADTKLSLGAKVNPIRFRELLPTGGKELDLEDLIIDNPYLLNFHDISEFSELLIIDRQPCTQTQKRADLFAVSNDGALVIIELKRDAEDERNRYEAMEFQAIRYAAASRKLTPKNIVDRFASYLEKMATKSASPVTGNYRNQAIEKLCEHLADEGEELEESDLERLLDPRSRQRIYLVAAGYDPDVLSGCAWLREHKIDIVCFRLRPYVIAGQKLLERERLIPPPELDDFLVDMRPSHDGGDADRSEFVRRPSDKPTTLKWGDDTHQTVASWKYALVESMTKVLDLGLSPADLPMAQSVDGTGLRSPHELKPGVYIQTHGPANVIQTWISKALRKIGKEKGYLQILTQSGQSIELPN